MLKYTDYPITHFPPYNPPMRPFLKWAGGKYRLVDEIKALIPPDGRRLVEPFVGSGALFLNTDFPTCHLADGNADLITLYRHLQAEGDAFVDYCRPYFTPENNRRAAYYAHRDRFNTTSEPREKAALFLYLNRHGYNGLCRYNQKGRFNVPFGRHPKPYFPAREMAYFAARAQRATFHHADFRATLATAVPGDVVYCDPPYVPLSPTANFTAYSAGKFTLDHQAELAGWAARLAADGVTVILSNHDTPFTRRAYAGARAIHPLTVPRLISRDAHKRQPTRELLALFN